MSHRSIEVRSPPWLPIFVAFGLANCTQPAAPGSEALTQRLSNSTAEAPEACVVAEAARNLVATDPATIVYQRGDAIYVNRLAGSCPGLRQSSTIIVLETNGGQYCRGDRFRTRDQGADVLGPTCILGDWIPYRR